ncbi:hypothetical protein E3Q18_03026 [Wallemia mellicola]|nr:hypothetical protein E3Q18_03026 [Wallemia mellicola]
MVNIPSPSILQAIGTGFEALHSASNSNKVKLLHESYRRAVLFVPSLSVLSALSYTLARKHVSLPAVLIFSLLPYTGVAVMPVNKKLFSKENYPDTDVDSDSTVDSLLSKWMYVHSVRILLAGLSTIFGFAELFKLLKSGTY